MAKREWRYADDAHRRFCEAETKAVYDRAPVIHDRWAVIKFPQTKYTYGTVSGCAVLCYPVEWDEKKNLRIGTLSNDLLDPQLRTMPGHLVDTASDFVDMEWYEECLAYIRSLSRLELVILADYTFCSAYGTYAGVDKIKNEMESDDIDEEGGGFPKPINSFSSLVWPGIVILAERGVDGTPLHEMKDILRKTPDLVTLREGFQEYLPRRGYGKKSELPVSKDLAETLKNIATWEEAVATLSKLDPRQTDLRFLIANWMFRYLTSRFLTGPVLKAYRDELNRILKNSPVIKRDMVVYRGVTSDYYLTDNGERREVLRNDYAVSASVNPEVALQFQQDVWMTSPQDRKGRDKDCCIKVIRIMPGTPAMCTWPFGGHVPQAEIVIPPGTEYVIKSHELRHVIAGIPPRSAAREDVCWDQLIDKKTLWGDPLFPKRWVTEMYVGPSGAFANKRKADPAPAPAPREPPKPKASKEESRPKSADRPPQTFKERPRPKSPPRAPRSPAPSKPSASDEKRAKKRQGPATPPAPASKTPRTVKRDRPPGAGVAPWTGLRGRA
eukprot:jgi/Mesvir1/10376/Mv10576-RA.1